MDIEPGMVRAVVYRDFTEPPIDVLYVPTLKERNLRNGPAMRSWIIEFASGLSSFHPDGMALILLSKWDGQRWYVRLRWQPGDRVHMRTDEEEYVNWMLI